MKTSKNLKNKATRLKEKNLFDANLTIGAKKFHSITNRTGPGKPMTWASKDGTMGPQLTREWKLCVTDSGEDRYQRREEMYEPVATCPVCGGEKRNHLVSRYSLDIVRCTDCSHGYLDPRIKYEDIHKIYWNDTTSAAIFSTPTQIKVDSLKYDYGLKLADTWGFVSKERILDIGCGTGLFLKRAKRFGFTDCVGIDPNKLYLDCYEGIDGINFYSSDFEALELEELGVDFDCMSMWSVLEHIYDPVKFLTRLSSLMRKGGLFIILVPNTNALSTRLFRGQSPIFVWKHVSYFTIPSLNLLMEKMGYKAEIVETVITEIGNIRNYLAWDNQYSGDHENDTTFDFITPEFIHNNLMGSRILGVYRKV